MNATKPAITPRLTVAELLDAYPELEDVLVRLAKPFEKLRHPAFRKTVARFTTLERAASIAGVPLPELVRTLRETVGQAVDLSDEQTAVETQDPREFVSARPAWVRDADIAALLNAEEMLGQGEHPVGTVLALLGKLPAGQVLCLESGFAPEPLIELVGRQGHDVYLDPMGAGRFRTYMRRGDSGPA